MSAISLQPGPRALGALAQAGGGSVRGDPSRLIHGVNVLADARPGEISFFNNAKYREALRASQATAVIVREEAADQVEGRDLLLAKDPYLAFAHISALFHPRPAFPPGIDPRAVVEAGAQVDPSATVMAFAYVGEGARVGPRAVLFPGVYLGPGSTLGEDSVAYPGVAVRERCEVGARCILQPGVVLGGDGFGFAFDAENLKHVKIPQVGRVVIEDEVEVGSNSAVDRATSGETRVGFGTKVDNLVQVGHNVQVGPLCILCGQVGIAGSASLGAGVVCGGQVGIGNHLHVVDRARIGPKAGVMADVEEAGEWLGAPLMKAREFLRAQAAYQRGPETLRSLSRLEKRVAELEEKLAALERRGA